MSMLRKWIIEPFGLQRMFYEEFPNDFVQLHGKPLHDIVFTLTEKKEVVPALPGKLFDYLLYYSFM